VLVAGGRYVTGTLVLKDDVTLHIAAGAALLGSTNIADYATNTHKNMYKGEPHMDRCLIYAQNATGIGIEGSGAIDGQGHREHFPNPGDPQKNRPMLVRFLDCAQIRVRDVRLCNPAAWTSAWLYCSDIVVDGVTIHSRANGNGDGLDFDGCRNVRVANCAFDTSDDSICLQTSRPDRPCTDVTIINCIFTSKWAGIRIGLLSRGDFENVTVSNCIFRDISDSGLKIQMCEGAVMQNMAFSNLVMHDVPRPVFMTLGQQRCCVDAPQELAPVGRLRRMLFSQLLVDNRDCGPASQFVLTGLPGAPVEDVVLHGIRMTTGGGGTAADARLEGVAELVPENLAGHWPEYTCFGRTLPAYGLYARHVRGLEVHDLTFDTVTPDARQAVVLEDVKKSLPQRCQDAKRAQRKQSL
jgi:hypothetical protein